MGLLSKLFSSIDGEDESGNSDSSDESGNPDSNDGSESELVAMTHDEVLEMDESELSGPSSFDFDSRKAPSGWKLTKDDKILGIQYRKKGLLQESTILEVQVIPGAGAQLTREEPSSSAKQVLTNGMCTVPEAVTIAQLFMAYGITLSACPVRVPGDKGVRFSKMDIHHYVRVMKQTDMHPMKQHAEYMQKLGDTDSKLNKFTRGVVHQDPYNTRR